jgi:hypothetical protein
MSTAATSPGPAGRFSARRRPFDVVPLAELCGPVAGVITLPRHVKWSGKATPYDVADPIARRTAYKHLLEEGLADDLRRYVNAELFAADLPHMVIRPEIRAAWQRAIAMTATARR